MLFTLLPSAWAEGYGEALLPIATVKAHLRVDGDDEDALISALRDASIDMVEQYTNVRLAPVAGMKARFAAFGDRMRVGVGPAAMLSATAIAYIDAAGGAQTMTAGAWRVDSAGGLTPAAGAAWPVGGRDVEVTFDAGYPEGGCPPALIAAAMMFLAHLYSNREAVMTNGASGELSLGFTALCDRYRMPVL
ncbi:putative phiE125 gp8 family phage protein [Hephaestia caeni]|uniref:Putative phiE125 gp8 family phage protein n=1 Tax=Hephaestia caeni TaxID=645617 RepID=A0A397NIZ7_9SPHN|nr:head-tail connector protein [Hephaestia caeni]RIA37480.1 putative phiE125 gp8 family phage protein [Hephaestia caeni]